MKLPRLNNSGQTLIFVILLMSVALAVGTSISSRTISTIRRTTNTDSAARATAAAEAAIESYLSKSLSQLETAVTSAGLSGCTEPTPTIDYPAAGDPALNTETDDLDVSVKVGVGRYGCLNSGTDTFSTAIAKDGVLELKLKNSSGGTGTLNVCFNSPSGEVSSLYNILINGSSPNYNVSKYGYNQSTDTSHGNNFTNTSGGDNCYSINLGSNPQLLRITSLYNNSNVTITSPGGYILPSQGYKIIAVGTIGEVEGSSKTVIATKSLPYLPAPFNFGIFSQSAGGL